MRTEHPRSDTDPYSLGHIDRGVNAGAVRHRGSGERDRDYFGCRRTRGCVHSDFNCLGLPARAASTFPGALLAVAGVITHAPASQNHWRADCGGRRFARDLEQTSLTRRIEQREDDMAKKAQKGTGAKRARPAGNVRLGS